MVLILATCAALGTLAAAGEDVQVVCEWDFARGMQEWVANSTAQVKQDKGGIVIETDGRDPQLTSPKLDIEPRAGDVLDRVLEDRLEDFSSQTIRGHEALWARMADAFGRDWFVPTCPMQSTR